MLQSPLVVSLASVVPGLGFLLLGRWKQALWVWLALLGLFALYNFSAVGSFWELLGIRFFFFVWFGQGFLAFQEARMTRALETGQLKAAREITEYDAIVPANLPRPQRAIYKIQKYVQAQCDFGEQVQAALIGFSNANYRLGTCQFSVGFTAKNLVVLDMGPYGKPISVEKYPLDQTRLKYKKGFLQDTVQLELPGQTNPFLIYVNWGIRKATLEFVEKFPKEAQP